MYIVLSGAKTNLGDFLITERATALLRHLRPDRELVVRPAWEPLDPEDDTVRAASAIVIAGGPGYRPDMVPHVYPLVPDLEALGCPVVPLGVGFKGRAIDPLTLRAYRFSETTLRALRVMADRAPGLGCRDRPTVSVLRAHGLHTATLVGCPVWYDLASLGARARLPSHVKRLVFTPAQQRDLALQSIELGKELARLFPEAERICSFHRGLDETNRWTPKQDIESNQRIARELAGHGFAAVDVAGDLAKIQFYDDCCLHVGYRVHAHIYFLSKRRPSVLVHEDGRGAGVSATLDVHGVDAYAEIVPKALCARLEPVAPPRLLQRLAATRQPDPLSVDTAISMLAHDRETGFARFCGVPAVIDAHFERMRDFIQRLP